MKSQLNLKVLTKIPSLYIIACVTTQPKTCIYTIATCQHNQPNFRKKINTLKKILFALALEVRSTLYIY